MAGKELCSFSLTIFTYHLFLSLLVTSRVSTSIFPPLESLYFWVLQNIRGDLSYFFIDLIAFC